MSSRNAPPHKVCGEERYVLASPQTSFGVRLSRIHFSPTERSGKQSNIQFGPCWEAPRCLWLVMYLQLSSSDQYGNWWAEYKNIGSYSRLSLPFSFSRFSRLRLPFSHLACWLFSLALLFASILSCFLLPWLVPERNYFRKPWDFFSFPKINFIKSRKISPRQGFKKDKPFVRVTPAQTQPNLRWMVVKSSGRQACLF